MLYMVFDPLEGGLYEEKDCYTLVCRVRKPLSNFEQGFQTLLPVYANRIFPIACPSSLAQLQNM